MLALLEYEHNLCGGCGGWLPETTDAKNEGRYHSEPPFRCHRCDVLHAARADADPAQVLWPVTLNGAT